MDLHLAKPPKVTILAHLMQWFQPGNEHCLQSVPFGQYDSADPAVIEKQIYNAQRLGIDGFMVDWYGTADQHGLDAFDELVRQCHLAGMKAGICIDKGALTGLDYNTSFATQYNYVVQQFAPAPAFFSDFIMEFGCGKKGVTTWPSGPLNIIHDDPTYGQFYTWVGLPNGASSVASNYTNPNCVMSSVCWDFDDSDPNNPTQSVWGGSVRLMNHYKSMLNWHNCWRNIPANMTHVQIVTWNDYQEGTAIEHIVEMFA